MVVQVLRLAVVLWVQLYLLAPEMTKLPMLVEHYREHTGANSALDLSAFLELHYADGSHQDSDHQEHVNLPFHHHHSGAVDHAGCKVLSSAPSDPVSFPELFAAREEPFLPEDTELTGHQAELLRPPRTQA